MFRLVLATVRLGRVFKLMRLYSAELWEGLYAPTRNVRRSWSGHKAPPAGGDHIVASLQRGCTFYATDLVSCNMVCFALRPALPIIYLGRANRYKVTLTQREREQLTELTRSGKSTAAKFVHARALLLCDAGKFGDPWKVAEVAMALG